ncbi:hypothetical protein V6N11_034084 [Hibiscus sabdariffa]|uniref:DUF4283 domain-containing protein n=1 Tax=Hibiscus sabdariffa TaxID=183260 RepID=A0ABR2S268_9ROSI
MAVDLPDPQARTKPNDKRVAKSSYAAALVGAGTGHGATLVAENDDIDLRDDDAMTGLVNRMSAIQFSDRAYKLMEASMMNTIIIKLLGRYWFPWTKDFSTSQPYPETVTAWIHLSRLPEFMYKRRVLWSIGGLVGKVVKLDYHTDQGMHCRFARMAVYVNLTKPPVCKVMIGEWIQMVEYENLPVVCFSCECFGYLMDSCPINPKPPGASVDPQAVHLTPLPESPLDAPNAQNIVATEKASERLLQDDVTKSGNVCQQQGLGRKGNVVQRTRNTRVVIVDDRDVNRLTIPRRDGKEPCPSKKGNGKTDVPKISSLKGHSNASAGARITATFRRLLGLIQMLQGAVWHPFWRQTL